MALGVQANQIVQAPATVSMASLDQVGTIQYPQCPESQVRTIAGEHCHGLGRDIRPTADCQQPEHPRRFRIQPLIGQIECDPDSPLGCLQFVEASVLLGKLRS